MDLRHEIKINVIRAGLEEQTKDFKLILDENQICSCRSGHIKCFRHGGNTYTADFIITYYDSKLHNFELIQNDKNKYVLEFNCLLFIPPVLVKTIEQYMIDNKHPRVCNHH